MLLFDPSYNTNVHPSHVLIFCVQGTTLNMIPSMQFALSGLLDHWLHNTDSDVADQGLWDEILMSIMHAQTQAQIRQVCSCLQSLFLNQDCLGNHSIPPNLVLRGGKKPPSPPQPPSQRGKKAMVPADVRSVFAWTPNTILTADY